MAFRLDSPIPVSLAALLLAAPALAQPVKAPAEPVTKPAPRPVRVARVAPKPAAAPAEAEAVPADPAALVTQARDAQARGETELAVRLAQSAIVADPARTSSYNALADIYAASGEGDFARTYYDQALEIDPADPVALKAIAALDQGGATRATASATGSAATP